MARKSFSNKIWDLLQQDEYEEARRLLEAEREKDPQNHWILTQLGVTYYEQRRYRQALKLDLAARRIVPDCPLVLWNLAGTLDALGHMADALKIYTWLLQSNKSPEDDPCWESKKWTAALKTDCVYRLGICFEHLGKKQAAEQCFRQYVNLLLIGIDGTYSIEEAQRHIRDVRGNGKHGATEPDLRTVFNAALQASGIKPTKGRQKKPPELNLGELLTGSHAASHR